MTKNRELTEHEKILWDQAMTGVKKLDSTHHTPSKQPSEVESLEEEESSFLPPLTSPHDDGAPVPCRQIQQPDPSLLKKIKQGKVGVQGRVDLHGMTQDKAYQALRTFIPACQTTGKKVVLVITGKGGLGLSEADRPKGVLRENVPKWLHTFPEVLSFAPALKKHGGDGALYVIIKRLKKGEA